MNSDLERLASILHYELQIVNERGQRRKLIIFTEHVDTLKYLWGKIATLFGIEEMLAKIHGSVSREARNLIEKRFRNDPDVYFLLAMDTTGEGIILQQAHLMINYDLPWIPNRLLQQFGRIHRIGQTEVCHLWNLVAGLLISVLCPSTFPDDKVLKILQPKVVSKGSRD